MFRVGQLIWRAAIHTGKANAMQQMFDAWPVIFPYYEVDFWTAFPGGGSSQSYVEDCAICCSPWVVHVQYAGGEVHVTVTQTDA